MKTHNNGLAFTATILLFVLIALGFVCNEYLEVKIIYWRIFGICLEIVGIITVVVNISRDSGRYNQAGYISGMIRWIKDTIFSRKGCMVSVSGSAILHMTGGAEARVGISDGASNDQKIEFIIKEIEILHVKIKSIGDKAASDLADLSEKCNDQDSKQQRQIQLINDALKDRAIGDYYLMMTGCIFTIAGMILTNLPDQIMNYFGLR